MSFVSSIIGTAERVPLPDVVIRAAIHRLCSRTATRLATGTAESDAYFAGEMAARAIAEHTDAANAQHYEVPAAFFALVLGPNRKYSSCFYKEPETTLREAEEEALRQTIEHADLADGQSVLELGCGWGSLSLWMARQFPHSTIVAVSNSSSQRAYIEHEAAKRGLTNLRVITSDMNVFTPEAQFDRIVSVEMFEHMMNWRELMSRVRSWLKPDGRFFVHIFTHRAGAYLFDRTDNEDWIAQHFFTGGVMPSHHLVRQYADIFAVEKEWRWSGTHYQRTALDWLANFDGRRDQMRRHSSRCLWQRHRIVDAPLALVLPRHRRPVRPRRWQRMGRQPLQDEGGVIHPSLPHHTSAGRLPADDSKRHRQKQLERWIDGCAGQARA